MTHEHVPDSSTVHTPQALAAAMVRAARGQGTGLWLDPCVGDGAFVAESNNDNQVRVWAVCPECQAPNGLLKASRSSVVSPLTSLERAEAATQAR